MRNEIEEEYELSQCSESAFRQYWPDSVTPMHPFFNRYMYELQLALIECKIPLMFRADKVRALDTVRQIKSILKGGTQWRV